MSIKRYDGWFFVAVMALIGFGVVMVYSTSGYYAQIKFGDSLYFLKKQALYSLIGITIMSIFMVIDYRLLRRMVYPILAGCFVMLILVWVPGLGKNAGGSQRWIDFGLFWIQPSEMAKLGMIIYLAHITVKKKDRMHTFGKGFVPPVIISGIIVLLVFIQPDFGTAVTLCSIMMAMLFIGGAHPVHVFGSVLMSVPVVYIGLMGAEYRRERILAFLNPWASPQDSGFQIIQSYLALGNGGISGVGLGMGQQKMFYLPMAHTDFILSVIGEELGLIGVCVIVVLFVMVLIRGMKIALTAVDAFGSHLAAGITMLFTVEALINMGVVMGLLPTKGLPLPLVSYGGSSIIVTMAAAGIMLNISAVAEEEAEWNFRK